MAGRFEPKVPVQLNPPKDDPITLEELAKADGTWALDGTHPFKQMMVNDPADTQNRCRWWKVLRGDQGMSEYLFFVNNS